jgi:flagellar basal body-associated protein FliL
VNDIWIPITIILVIYAISVVVVIIRSTSKSNKEIKSKEKLVKCNVCGNMIPENAVECPYCHQLIRKNQ